MVTDIAGAAGPPPPRGTWEHAISAEEELTLWRLETVRRQALSALQGCAATARFGEDEQQQLLNAFGTLVFTAVQDGAEDVLVDHIADSARPGPSTADRAPVLARAHRARALRALHAARPWSALRSGCVRA
ncbi:hypothetical protein P3T36_006438 [Kitasatospora sp. MAP12-15]|uniref:hypothetical protein n=1 Tax=unclassified Kitasatospora TaxID=2633591 RepID=UPI0024743AD7|nr:hypothetical protein [Kitasatospora sp. MAP12-44]MDH6107826.1 hypothetical protein [Kitasatospora sp. MAP12-44]